MVDNLTKEIINRILADVGAAPGDLFGKRGLEDSSLKLSKTLKVRYEDIDRFHDIYAGQLELGSSKIRGLFVDLSIDDVNEFLFLFRMDTMPIHAVKALYDYDEHDGFIRIYDSEKQIWKETSTYMMARLLAEFERFVSVGLLWDDCREITDLYDVAITLVK